MYSWYSWWQGRTVSLNYEFWRKIKKQCWLNQRLTFILWTVNSKDLDKSNRVKRQGSVVRPMTSALFCNFFSNRLDIKTCYYSYICINDNRNRGHQQMDPFSWTHLVALWFLLWVWWCIQITTCMQMRVKSLDTMQTTTNLLYKSISGFVTSSCLALLLKSDKPCLFKLPLLVCSMPWCCVSSYLTNLSQAPYLILKAEQASFLLSPGHQIQPSALNILTHSFARLRSLSWL